MVTTCSKIATFCPVVIAFLKKIGLFWAFLLAITTKTERLGIPGVVVLGSSVWVFDTPKSPLQFQYWQILEYIGKLTCLLNMVHRWHCKNESQVATSKLNIAHSDPIVRDYFSLSHSSCCDSRFWKEACVLCRSFCARWILLICIQLQLFGWNFPDFAKWL